VKILHISPRYFTNKEIGGGERYPLELAKALSKYAETTLLVFGDKRNTIQINELRIEVYPEWSFGRSLKLDPFSISFLHELKNTDIVHIHQFRKVVSNISILWSRVRGKPIFITDHGGGDPISIYLFSFLVGHLASGFLTVSKFSGKNFLQFNRPVKVIYGGVDVSVFYPRKIERENNKVLFVGRFLPLKGCEYLVKAVQDLDVKLHMIGVPTSQKVINTLRMLDKNKKVRFRFSVPDCDELAKEYSSSVVTILPSVYIDYYGDFHKGELLGLTLLESMACETPVICTKVGGMPEIVADGETGFVVNPNDPLAIRNRIEYLINNPEEARRMGQFGRRIVLKNYTWDAVAGRCLAAYKESYNIV